MPTTVAIAVTLQLLLAATFLVVPITAWFTGAAAQRNAEAEVVRQGHPADVLARHGIRFVERPSELALALAVGAISAALAWLNLTGNGAGRILSWVIEPVVLLAVGTVTAGQVFATRYTRAVLAKSEDAAARAIDAPAVIASASAAFPFWLRPVVLLRFALATLGPVAVIVLLTTQSAAGHFQ